MTEVIEKPLSKAAIKRAEIQARREARETKKATTATRILCAKEKLIAMSKTMPADYQEWGVIRTRGYMQLREIALGKLENTTISPDTLENYIHTLRNASTWTLDYCQHLALLHSCAANITPVE